MADRVRDHLANERTFLAWVRTGLGLIGLGFVLARMGLFLRQMAMMEGDAKVVRGMHAGGEFLGTGVVFLLAGTGLVGWAGWWYGKNREAIEGERFEPARGSVIVLAGGIAAGGVVILGLVLWRLVGG